MKKQLWDGLLAIYVDAGAAKAIAKTAMLQRRRVFTNLMHLNIREWVHTQILFQSHPLP
jgi:hypothetical protein